MARRTYVSQKRIEQTIMAGISAGLTPASVSHYPDGRTVVNFGGVDATVTTNKRPRGWDI